MQTFQEIFNLLLKDIQKELNEEFDRNFERKAFFTTAWKTGVRNKNSLLMASGALRKAMKLSVINGNEIRWEASYPYAEYHNSGATITVTKKMRGWFWYQFRLVTGGNNKNLNADALFWRSLGLKKVGSIIIIPKRQFIGTHPVVESCINDVVNEWFNNDVKQFIDDQLNNIVK